MVKREVSGFLRRIIAYAIDLLILNILILKPFKSYLNLADILAFNLITKEFVIATLSISILSLLYWTLLEFTVRQSLGKMITRIYVASTKKQLTLQQCFIRNIPKMMFLVLALDTLYAIISRTHQRYFEKLSDTEVLAVGEKV